MFTYIKKNYHWIIAVIVFLEMIVYGGLINSASLFIQPISETLGVPTTAYSVAMMPYTVTCLSAPAFPAIYLPTSATKKPRWSPWC
jgi:hypothetical protein